MLSPDYVPNSPSDLLLTPERPRPRPPRDGNRVYAVFNKAGSLMGVLTSPVDAAEAVKNYGAGSFVQTCVLNAID